MAPEPGSTTDSGDPDDVNSSNYAGEPGQSPEPGSTTDSGDPDDVNSSNYAGEPAQSPEPGSTTDSGDPDDVNSSNYAGEPPQSPEPGTNTEPGLVAADVDTKQAFVDAINTLGWGRGYVDPVILKVMGKYVWPDYDWQEVNDV